MLSLASTKKIQKTVSILVVDDSEDDFFQVSRLLAYPGGAVNYRLKWEHSYTGGLDAATQGDYDVAIVDYRLGHPTGLELLARLRKLKQDLPIILLTGHDDPEVDALAASEGAADFLCKNTLTRVELERSIRYALSHAQSQAALRRSQQQLELFMQNVPCAVCICDQEGRLLFQNEPARRSFTTADLGRWLTPSGTGVPEMHVTKDRHWLVSTFPITSPDGSRLIGIAGTDITAQVLADQELRRTSRLLNAILAHLPVMAGRLDPDGTVKEMRGRGLEDLGVREADLVGINLLEKYPSMRAHFAKAVRGESAGFMWDTIHEGRRHYFENYLHRDPDQENGAITFAVNVTSRVEAEAEADRQARLLGDIMKKLPVIVGQLDSTGRVVTAQGDGFQREGFRPEDLIGKFFHDVHPAGREPVERALQGEEVNFTLHGPPGENQWHAEFYVTSYHDLGATFIGRDVSERRWLERRLLTASDAEQQRIGADLHDGLGQKLTGLSCLAAALREKLRNAQSKEAEQAALVSSLANEAIMQARALARGLCPVELAHTGLAVALVELSAQTELLHGITCRFEAPDMPPPCDHLTATHLYRIAQESITNAIRHGGARTIEIALLSDEHDEQQHCLVIKDDGKGFDLRDQKQRRSNGLRLMEYRANMIGGTLSIDSRPGGGTRISCRFETSKAQAVPA